MKFKIFWGIFWGFLGREKLQIFLFIAKNYFWVHVYAGNYFQVNGFYYSLSSSILNISEYPLPPGLVDWIIGTFMSL